MILGGDQKDASFLIERPGSICADEGVRSQYPEFSMKSSKQMFNVPSPSARAEGDGTLEDGGP